MNSLSKLLKKWQRLLKLQDWDITVELCEDDDFEELEAGIGYKKGDLSAYNSLTSDRKSSKIYVKKACPDYELYLVHELSHILLDPLDNANTVIISEIPSEDIRKILVSRSGEALEESVWNTARALINTFASRGQKGEK